MSVRRELVTKASARCDLCLRTAEVIVPSADMSDPWLPFGWRTVNAGEEGIWDVCAECLTDIANGEGVTKS